MLFTYLEHHVNGPALPVAFFSGRFLLPAFLVLTFFGIAFLVAAVLRVVILLGVDGLTAVGVDWPSASAGNEWIASITASRTICGNSAIITADTVRRTSSATVADNTFISKGTVLFWVASATTVSTFCCHA